MSMMVSFVLSFFPRDVLDEILNLIESVSEDFPSYSYEILLKGRVYFLKIVHQLLDFGDCFGRDPYSLSLVSEEIR